MACTPKISAEAKKYLEKLDRSTARRIVNKIESLANDPYNFRFSKPLKNSKKRTARVGDYRILFVVDKIAAGEGKPAEEILFVADIGPRGQVYRAT